MFNRITLPLLAGLLLIQPAFAKDSFTHGGNPRIKRAEVPLDLDLTADMPPTAPMTNAPRSAKVSPTNRPPATVKSNHTVAPKPAPLPTAKAYSVPAESWVALDSWARRNHLGGLNDRSSPGAPMFALKAPTGEFVIRPPSNLASWNGLELRLGFEPQMIDDEPHLHRLDLEKNLVPLLVGVPVPAPKPRTIVLDPGHGGADSGTRSAQGDLEKDYTLDWAQRVARLLREAGWKVALTRNGDEQISLGDRVAFADAHKADVFLSLHFNATVQPYHAGIETYCLTPTGMPSNVTRGYEDNASLVFPNNMFDAQNLQLALNIHRSVLAATGGRDRGVRRARFLGVLRGQSRPAVLIEGGYLSNPDEARLIISEDYRQKLAQAVADALK